MADIKPDDICGVCNETRENHGDKQHKFSIEGILEEKDPPAPPRQAPPRERGQSPEAAALGRDPVAGLVLRLIETLVQKEVLKGDDLVKLFGGGTSDNSGGGS